MGLINTGFAMEKFDDNTHYLYSLKTREAMHLYYGVKSKHGHSLENREQFISETATSLADFVKHFDFVVYPESSNSFIAEIVNLLGLPSVQVSKNDMASIVEQIDSLKLQKSEKASHLERIYSMTDSFKINAMKATQRRKYEHLLFQKTNVPEGVGLIIDDSHFSGTTFRGLTHATGVNQYLAIFSK